MNAPLFFESAGDDRGTPQKFFDALHAEFHFDIDAAADEHNHKCELYYGKGGMEYDALEADWAGLAVFLNPPYSIAGAFIAKARAEADKGATVVMLLPVRTDTQYWHKYIWDKSAGRLVNQSPEVITTGEGSCVKYAPMLYHKDGDFYPGVRVRFIPGRLQFELKVPDSLRSWIKAEMAKSPAGLAPGTIVALVAATGLPKMAIDRILLDYPDEDLMESAPFPSCVVIFTKAS